MRMFDSFRSIRDGALSGCAMAVVLGFLLVVPAQAAVHFVNLGTAAPPSTVGGIAVTPFNVAPQAALADDTSVTIIPGCPAPGSLTFSTSVMKLTAPTSWSAMWGNGYAGPVFFCNPSSATLTLPPGTTAFYFYSQPDQYGTESVTAVTDSGTSSGPIPVTVGTSSGAANGFAFYADGGDSIKTITISVDASIEGFALAEFGIAVTPGWAVVANDADNDIVTYDLSTDPPTKHGPFLQGQLGNGGSLLDIAVAPGGHYALAANFYDSTVYRIDLSNPAAPAADCSVPLPILPEDIAFSPDGSYAMITDGSNSNRIVVIDMADFSLKTTYTLQAGGANAQAIAIAADNSTWVAVDNDNNQILYGTYSLASGFSGEQSLPAGSGPVNVSISPDGQTVLVANTGSTEVSVYRITGPGTLVAEPAVTGLPSGCQSFAFSPDGSRAYVLSDEAPPTLSWISVTGPGAASLGGANVASLPIPGGGNYYGVDQLAVSTDGKTAIAANPAGPGSTDIALIDTSSFAATTVDTGSSIPRSVATFVSAGCPPIAVSSDPSPIPSAVAGAAYPPTHFTASGGTGPYTYALSCDSSLPPGLTLSADGTLAGTLTTSGSYTFTIVATDSDGCTGRQSFTVSAYSLSFFDDAGSSAACVDTTTGAFQWNVLSGPFTGMTYTGTLNVYNGGTMFWSQPGASQYVYIYYDPNGHTAWGYLYDYSTGLYSSLYDSDTLNNPAGCGSVPSP